MFCEGILEIIGGQTESWRRRNKRSLEKSEATKQQDRRWHFTELSLGRHLTWRIIKHNYKSTKTYRELHLFAVQYSQIHRFPVEFASKLFENSPIFQIKLVNFIHQ